MFAINIQSDASNNHWNCDHHALATSPCDGAPSVSDALINDEAASCTFAKAILDGYTTPRIAGVHEQLNILNVPSPEDPSKLRDIAIEVITVDQVLTVLMR